MLPTRRSSLLLVAVSVIMIADGCVVVGGALLGIALEEAAANSTRTSQGKVIFSRSEAKSIRAYYSVRADLDSEYPGLPSTVSARSLKRYKKLPSGLATQPLPNELIETLPESVRGYERAVVPSVCKVLLIKVETQTIHDVLDDVHTSSDCRAKTEGGT